MVIGKVLNFEWEMGSLRENPHCWTWILDQREENNGGKHTASAASF